VSAEDDIQGDQAPAKRQKMLKNLRTLPQRLSLNNPWARRHHWDQLWSVSDLYRKSEHSPHCHEVCSPTLQMIKAAACKCVFSYERRLMRTQLSSPGS
jgi:hypothetical protein